MTRIISNKMRMTATERRKTHVLASVTFPCISTNNVCAVATAQKMQHHLDSLALENIMRVCLRKASGGFGSLLYFSGQALSGQAPSSQAVSMHSIVVWLRAHPEPG
jgi:hypothetical protein